MIAHLEGPIARIGDRFVVLSVAGIGYRISVTADTARLLGKKKENAFLFTYHAVREDAEDLYGFIEEAELELFEMLLGVSGIGPRSALQIMGLAGVETLKKAISSEDTSYLTKVSGIGRKTAEKIVLELKDKLGGAGGMKHGELREESDAVEALKSLGYSQAEARDALK
ncbi:MAG: Holliday junction branch migration protein RuvA, partial [bacterium]|nr:Holliday junction branch migration protein RuvA [bacterium]